VQTKDILLSLITGTFLLMFTIVHAIAILRSFRPENSVQDPPDDPLSQSATVLLGLVAGIVSLFFGIESTKFGFNGSLIQILKYAYVIDYLAMGFICWLVWIIKRDTVLLAVRNLALSFIGIGLATVTLAFNELNMIGVL